MSRATAGGGDRADLLGRDLTDLVQAQDPTVMHDMLATAPGRTTHVELTLVHADGSTTPVLASATGLDLDGSVVRCLIVADLTRRVEAEELSASEEQYRLLAERLRRGHAPQPRPEIRVDVRFGWGRPGLGRPRPGCPCG